MEENCTPGTGSDNPAIAGSSGIVSEAALAHAPALTERNLREYGIPLQQALKQVLVMLAIAEKTARDFRILDPSTDALIVYEICPISHGRKFTH